MRRWSRVLVGLACCCVAALALSAESRFQRTVAALSAEDPALQARFAQIALLELAEIYLAEADLAREQAGPEGGHLRAWAAAVDRFGLELTDLAAAVEGGSPVVLRRYPREEPAVEVQGRSIVLAHPRPDQQAAFEQAVLERFCVADICSRLTAVPDDALPPPVAPAAVDPMWTFNADGAVCGYRGLQLRFEGEGDLPRRRDLCREFLQEAETLAVEAARQRRYGVAIDWESLQIVALSGRPGQLVLLNPQGDSLLADLPLLAATPGLSAAIVPWLSGRYAENGPPAVELSAAEFGWE